MSRSKMECRYVDHTLGDAAAGDCGTPEIYCGWLKAICSFHQDSLHFQESLILLALSLLLPMSFTSYGKFHQFIHLIINQTS